MMLWTSSHTKLSSRETSIIISCATLGYMFSGIVVGYLFQTYSPLWVMHITLAASVAQLIFFGLAYLSVKVLYQKEIKTIIDKDETNVPLK